MYKTNCVTCHYSCDNLDATEQEKQARYESRGNYCKDCERGAIVSSLKKVDGVDIVEIERKKEREYQKWLQHDTAIEVNTMDSVE